LSFTAHHGRTFHRGAQWLDSMNHALAEPVITAAPGGAGGGGANLTLFGTELLKAYQRIAKQVSEMAAENLAAFGRRALRRHSG